MNARIHLLLDERERDAFRACAAAEGLTLSAWLREAARERLERELAHITTVADLDRFFGERAGAGERDGTSLIQHLEVMGRSRRIGMEGV